MRTLPSDIVAIDMHVHLGKVLSGGSGAMRADREEYLGTAPPPMSLGEVAQSYRDRNMLAVVMNSTDVTRTGQAPLPNDAIADAVHTHPDVFLGFGAVDPRQGALAVRELERCHADLGLVGIGELNPARQGFYPNDPEFHTLWRRAAELGLPVVFHGGFAASGAGTPGGGGIKLKYARPIHLDELAADVPELTIVCAHPSWPWESEALAVAMHKRNVYLDLSGWAPRYLSDEVRRYVGSRIPNKVLFGSDWPVLDVDRWVSEFRELELEPDVVRRVMLDNAVELLGLRREDAPLSSGDGD